MGWLAGWGHRTPYTFDSNSLGLSGDVANKQVELHIDNSAAFDHFWANVKSDGGDVRITAADGTTLLKKGTMKFDSTGDDAWYKVKLPNVTAGTDVLVYIYYGKSDATSDDDIPNTLESDVLACWPLDLNAPGGAFADIASTNDGTNTGTTDAAGQVGRARAFSGTGQYISCGTGLAVTGARTIKASINGVHGAAALHVILAKYNTGVVSSQDFYFAIYQKKIRALITGNTTPTPLAKITNGGTTLSDNTTYLVGLSWDNSNQANHLKVWLDGVDDSSTYSDTGEFTASIGTTEPVLIGARNSGAPTSYYQGWIDEIVYYSTVKSADWWKVDNASVKGLWGSAGTPESLDYTHTPTGGSVGGGTSDIIPVLNFEMQGGSVAGGSADMSYVPMHTQEGQGGSVGGGSAVVTYALNQEGQGGSVGGGSATVVFVSPITEVPFIWRIIDPGTKLPVTGSAANTLIRIRRASDGLYLDWSDMTFKGSAWITLSDHMEELNDTVEPGAYIKTVDLAQFLDGKYEVFADYIGSFKDYAEGEFMVTGGMIADIQTSTAAISWLSVVRDRVEAIPTIQDTVDRIVGLVLENHVEDDIVRDPSGNKVSSHLYCYDSAAHATAHVAGGGGGTGLKYKYQVTFAYSAGRITLNKIVKVL